MRSPTHPIVNYMKPKKKTGLYEYLESLNLVGSGLEEDIAAARNAYRKAYKADWRRKKRSETNRKEYTVTLNTQEVQIITVAAIRHARSKTQFIKESSLAYVRRQFIVPDKVALGEVKHLLALNYGKLQQLFDEGLVHYTDGIQLLQRMDALEKGVLALVAYPKTIEVIVAEAVGKDPAYRNVILELLKPTQ